MAEDEIRALWGAGIVRATGSDGMEPETKSALARFGHGRGGALLLRRAFAVPEAEDGLSDRLGWRDPPAPAVELIRAVMSLLGLRPISYAAYGDGENFHRIGGAGRSSGLANLAERDLGPHTDLPHCALPGEVLSPPRQAVPHVLFLACIVGDGVTATSACGIHEALQPLSPSTVEALSEPMFDISAPSAWEGEQVIKGQACLRILGSRRIVRLSPNLMGSSSGKHQRAVEELVSSARSQMRSVILESGDLLVLDNLAQLHGRHRSADPAKSPSDRSLIRTYAVYPEVAGDE